MKAIKNGLKYEFGLYNVLELFSGKDENMIDTFLKIYSYIQSFDYPFEYLYRECEKYNIIENEIDLIDTDFGKEILNEVYLELNALLKKVESFRRKLDGNEDFIKFIQVFDNEISYIKLCLNSNNWDRLYYILQDFKMDRSPVYKGNNIELKEDIANFRKKIYKEGIEKIKKSIYSASENILKDNNNAYKYVKYICDFLQAFDKYYKGLKLSKNYIDFNDIEHLTLELLIKKDENGENVLTDEAKFIQNKFVEVYTDEYQDTSIIQEAILEAVSGSKNRFMVGDIKQSIYRFRQAMPDIFNNKYNEYNLLNSAEDLKEIKCNKIILAKNFRSRKNVLDSINYIFTRIMSKDMGDCNYSNLETLKFGATLYRENEDVDYTTEINIIDTKFKNSIDEINENESDEIKEDLKDETSIYLNELKNFELEAMLIAKRIKDLLEKFKVYNLKKDKFESVKYKDIVILLRSIKDKGNILEKTFKKYDIPAFCDANSSLFESDEIRLVLSFLKIIDNPLQDIYMVSIMYSIIGNFTLSELVNIRVGKEKEFIYYNLKNKKEELELNIDKLSEKNLKLLSKINKFIQLIEKFSNYSKIYNISDVIIRLYKETNIYYQFALEKSCESKKANLDLLIDFAIKFEKDSNSNISSYIKYIDKLKEKSDTSNSTAKILGENEDVVRIMTIHKSKGLEFPVVILCDTMKKYNNRDISENIILHHKLGIGVNVVNEEYGITYPSVIKQAIKNKIIKESKAEELRMLYVALTRAKEKLIIFGTMKDYYKKKNELFVMYKQDGTIDPFSVQSNNSYFENIMMAISSYKESNEFNINVIDKFDDVVKNNVEGDNIFNLQNRIIELKQNLDNENNINENVEKIRKHFEYIYPNFDEVFKEKRVSVSELKQKENEYITKQIYHNSDLIDKSCKKIEYKIPDCIKNENKSYTSVRKGILIHFILEHLNFKSIGTKQQIEDYINNLVKNKVLNLEDARYINIDSIYNLLISSIGKELKKSEKIFKEQEFILKNSSFSGSYIQGIIDLYYINEDGKVILVDFKTDKTKNKEDYVLKYKKQLDIYKEAIEKLTGLIVSKKYIYSFSLNDKIEIN